jgi:class 3 adenylate cyclase
LARTLRRCDLVGSTEALSAQGDQRRRSLDVHDEIIDRHVSKYGGAKTTGAASASTSALASLRSPDQGKSSRVGPFETAPRAQT